MFESLGRSWGITKLSMSVVKSDKELLLFPLFAGFFSLLFMILMVFPVLFTSLLSGVAEGPLSDLIFYAIVFVIYLGLAFIATFFNVCVVYTAKKRFEGGNSTFGEALGFAFSRLPVIIGWALVSATVGLILRILFDLANNLGPIGKLVMNIVISILGGVWGIITLFVVPALVYDNLGPMAAIKKSTQILSRTWGESLVRHFALGGAMAILLFVGIIVGIILAIVGIMISPIVFFVVIGLLVLYVLGLILLFNVLNSVYNTALYVYAEKGVVPSLFTQESLQGAFESKPKKKGIF